MWPNVHDHRFLSRLHSASLRDENARVERVLAYSRLFLAVTSLAAARIQPLAPPHYNHLAILMLVAYTFHSLALLTWLATHTGPGREFVLWAQVGDVVWPLLLCLFTDAPNSIFFIFFLFALMAAAFRWGFRETMLTAVIGAVLLLIQAVVMARGPVIMQQLLFTELDSSRIIVRCGYLLLTGFLLGYLSEHEKELRAEIFFTNRLLSMARVGNRFADVLREVSREFGRVFSCTEMYDVFSQVGTGRLYRWEIPSDSRPAHPLEISPTEKNLALMSEYPHSFYMRDGGKAVTIEALDDEGRKLNPDLLSHLPMPVSATSVLAIRLEMGREWQGRFVMLNGEMGRSRERELRFAQNVLRQIAPALYSLYLFRRLRARAGAMERARVARELHDTSIQSLIGIEMQVDVLRRRTNGKGGVASELERIQGLLRQEVVNLRELIQTMRVVDFAPHQFLDFIAQVVERFRRETGLEAQFVSELPEVTLPIPVCRELLRVVQEGLVNVRKHSSAHSVYVRFGTSNGCWQLVIDDDGHGFPFSGRLSLSELDAFHRGPTVIKERVRAIGGDLVLESSPGRGARLEITIPQKGYESYG